MMENKNLKRARLFSRIGGFIIVGVTVILILFGMIRPFNITYNDQHYYLTLWQMVEYTSVFPYMIGRILGFIMLGIVGLLIGKKLKTKATNTLGISLMILGLFTFPILGAGVFYFIAGIQTLLAKKVQEFHSLS
jgi:hypothetical protein